MALLELVIAGGGAIAPANPKQSAASAWLKAMLANLDGDTEAAFRTAIDKLKYEPASPWSMSKMPKLAELNRGGRVPAGAV